MRWVEHRFDTSSNSSAATTVARAGRVGSAQGGLGVSSLAVPVCLIRISLQLLSLPRKYFERPKSSLQKNKDADAEMESLVPSPVTDVGIVVSVCRLDRLVDPVTPLLFGASASEHWWPGESCCQPFNGWLAAWLTDRAGG